MKIATVLTAAAVMTTVNLSAQTATMGSIKDYLVSDMTNMMGGSLHQIMWMVKTPGSLTLNTECADPVTLSRNDVVIGSIYSTAVIGEDPYAVAFFPVATTVDNGDDLLEGITQMNIGLQFGEREITGKGVYTLSVPDAFFLCDNTPMPACKFTYNRDSAFSRITGNPEDGCTDAPASSLNSFSIKLRGVNGLTNGCAKSPYGGDYTNAKLSIKVNDVDVTDRYEITINKATSTLLFTTVSGREFTEGGTLSLQADKGYFFCLEAGALDAVFSFSYEFTTLPASNEETGVGVAVAGGLQGDVYTLNGVCVIKGADAASFESLPAGIYIIKGKKIVKK